MANNYGEIAFTNAVKEMQKKLGSRAGYARLNGVPACYLIFAFATISTSLSKSS